MSTIVSGDVQHEDERIKVTRWTLNAGESTGPHVHTHDYVVVPLADGIMSITDSAGGRSDHALTRGLSYTRSAGAQHTVANRNADRVDFVEIELL